jgi:hypothetical protein
LQVPVDFARAGWFAEGPSPGQLGPAVIAGHVDSWTGPAVFFRLRELLPGDTVQVELADGARLRFVVEQARRFPKATFPTAEVFGPAPWAALRLVTCGGDFDRTRQLPRQPGGVRPPRPRDPLSAHVRVTIATGSRSFRAGRDA